MNTLLEINYSHVLTLHTFSFPNAEPCPKSRSHEENPKYLILSEATYSSGSLLPYDAA